MRPNSRDDDLELAAIFGIVVGALVYLVFLLLEPHKICCWLTRWLN